MKNIVIIGANSAIAEATARIYASAKANFFLVARSEEKLQILVQDLKVRGAESVSYMPLNLIDTSKHDEVVSKAIESLGSIDLILIAHGVLPNEKECEENFNILKEAFEINTLSSISLIHRFTKVMEEKKQGVIACIGSVAGDRGRKSNYVYGASKAALDVFLQGLRNRLCSSGVHVLTIKPGFVDTPMTQSFKKGFLWASPEKIGSGICKAVLKKKNVVYLPGFWRMIMMVIRHVPEFVFKKTNF